MDLRHPEQDRPGRRRAAAIAALCALLAGPAGCENFIAEKVEERLPDDRGALPGGGDAGKDGAAPERLAGIGEPCGEEAPDGEACRPGLLCENGTCRALGTTGEGGACVLSSECVEGLRCGARGSCRPAGEGGLGSACATGRDCRRELHCDAFGFAGVCTLAGAAGRGDPCSEVGDCRAGLYCDASSERCRGRNPVFGGFEPWAGVDCPSSDDGPPRVHVQLPGDDGAVEPFFHLPHPNDVRRRDGGTRLDGFPRPGSGLVGRDPVGRLASAAAANQRGASIVPTVRFSLSEPVALDTLRAGQPDGAEATLRYVNVDPDSDRYGLGPGFSWFASTAGGRYVCPSWLTVDVGSGWTLEPGTTYAVLLTRGIEGDSGVPFARAEDLERLLADEAPGQPAARSAWEVYAPLRGWLDEQPGLRADDVLGATVFTTRPEPTAPRRIREAVRADAPPTPTEVTFCGGEGASPCADGARGRGPPRGCAEPTEEARELHLRLPLPDVQRGDPPHLDPDGGGGLAREADGTVEPEGEREVCVAITVPRGPMPESGWPVALFGHELGSSYREGPARLGEHLASARYEGSEAPLATVGWDLPLHGARAVDGAPPSSAFLQVANPVAIRGNVHQAVAEVHALVRALRHLEIPASETPTDGPLRFDGERMAWIGHGLGAWVGSVAAAAEPRLDPVVLSGGGAGLRTWVHGRTRPIVRQRGIALGLQELDDAGPAVVSRRHPVLARLQGFLDPVDPMAHAHRLVEEPPSGQAGRHVLQLQGVPDPWLPGRAGHALARRLGVAPVTPLRTDWADEPLTPPVRANRKSGGRSVTAAMLEVPPPEGEAHAHAALFDHPGVRRQVVRFLASWLVDEAPTVVPRDGGGSSARR